MALHSCRRAGEGGGETLTACTWRCSHKLLSILFGAVKCLRHMRAVDAAHGIASCCRLLFRMTGGCPYPSWSPVMVTSRGSRHKLSCSTSSPEASSPSWYLTLMGLPSHSPFQVGGDNRAWLGGPAPARLCQLGRPTSGLPKSHLANLVRCDGMQELEAAAAAVLFVQLIAVMADP